MGIFSGFLGDPSVRLVGVEAAGHGLDSGKHGAALARGTPGVLHGSRSYVLQDPNGQIIEAHSISAGLDYPGVGPELAWLKDQGRLELRQATDDEALDALGWLARQEGIIPALETAHAVHAARGLARELGPGGLLIVNISGRGDKDVDTVRKALAARAAIRPRKRATRPARRPGRRRPKAKARQGARRP
jgi:tryptophan synthase beta chain